MQPERLFQTLKNRYIYSFERSENVPYAGTPLPGGKIQNAIWPKIWMLIFILGQNKSKQAKKNFDPARL